MHVRSAISLMNMSWNTMDRDGRSESKPNFQQVFCVYLLVKYSTVSTIRSLIIVFTHNILRRTGFASAHYDNDDGWCQQTMRLSPKITADKRRIRNSCPVLFPWAFTKLASAGALDTVRYELQYQLSLGSISDQV